MWIGRTSWTAFGTEGNEGNKEFATPNVQFYLEKAEILRSLATFDPHRRWPAMTRICPLRALGRPATGRMFSLAGVRGACPVRDHRSHTGSRDPMETMEFMCGGVEIHGIHGCRSGRELEEPAPSVQTAKSLRLGKLTHAGFRQQPLETGTICRTRRTGREFRFVWLQVVVDRSGLTIHDSPGLAAFATPCQFGAARASRPSGRCRRKTVGRLSRGLYLAYLGPRTILRGRPAHASLDGRGGHALGSNPGASQPDAGGPGMNSRMSGQATAPRPERRKTRSWRGVEGHPATLRDRPRPGRRPAAVP